MLLRGAIDVAEQRAGLHDRALLDRVDGDGVHEREVDDDAVVAHAEPRQAVAATPDGDEQASRPGVGDRRDDVS